MKIKICNAIVIDSKIKIKIPETHIKIKRKLFNISNNNSKEGKNEEELKSNSSE